jgi:hypothetical protein
MCGNVSKKAESFPSLFDTFKKLAVGIVDSNFIKTSIILTHQSFDIVFISGFPDNNFIIHFVYSIGD